MITFFTIDSKSNRKIRLITLASIVYFEHYSITDRMIYSSCGPAIHTGNVETGSCQQLNHIILLSTT